MVAKIVPVKKLKIAAISTKPQVIRVGKRSTSPVFIYSTKTGKKNPKERHPRITAIMLKNANGL